MVYGLGVEYVVGGVEFEVVFGDLFVIVVCLYDEVVVDFVCIGLVGVVVDDDGVGGI